MSADWLTLVAASLAVGLAVGFVLCGRTATSTAGAQATSAASVSSGRPGDWLAAVIGAVNQAVQHLASRPAPRPVTAEQLSHLPPATTWGVVPTAPLDPAPQQVPSGELVSPRATVPVYATPGGPAIAALPAHQPDANHQPISPTFVPVIATQPGWARVLLPTKPNGSTGWVDTVDPRVSESITPYLITVDREHYRLTLLRSGVQIGQWTVGVGVLRPLGGVTQSVTPSGRTFVVADIQVTRPTYSPIILPLGVHSAIYETYGGGPGTVALHTWTYSSAVYGKPSSHGCIRVPADALRIVSTQVPIGTPVLIS